MQHLIIPALSILIALTGCDIASRDQKRMPNQLDGSSSAAMHESLDRMRELSWGKDNHPLTVQSMRDIIILRKHYGRGDSYEAAESNLARELDGLTLEEIHVKATESYLYLAALKRDQEIRLTEDSIRVSNDRIAENDPLSESKDDAFRMEDYLKWLKTASFAEYLVERGPSLYTKSDIRSSVYKQSHQGLKSYSFNRIH